MTRTAPGSILGQRGKAMPDTALDWLKPIGELITVAGAAAGAAIFVVGAQFQVSQQETYAQPARMPRATAVCRLSCTNATIAGGC